jgi:two-component system C4-dicarboxylate transport sensor histidine kinase DctB
MRNYIASLRLNGPAEDIERFTGRMEAVTERMDALTRQLRFFARPGEEAFARVDLAEVVRGAQEMMQADLAAAGVALKVEMPRRAVFVRGNRMRLEQVVVNLLQNARDAVAEVADKTVAVSGRSEGGTAVLSVRDNGSGIAAEVADQIFDPFTSTKPSGQGMGLGLSISRAIALDHGGSLEAAAAPGGGADFILRLPENPGAPGPA